MSKWLVLLAILAWFSWVGRRAWKRLVASFAGHQPSRQERNRPATSGRHIDDLTQQKISDADYEEIP
jgi:hypothetical protein